MQSELKQGKPFLNPEEELFLSLARTSDMLGNMLVDFLKEHGLSTTQYNVLRILRGAGEKGLTCGEISVRLVTRDPDVTRLLDRLEHRNLITRSRDTVDRRVVSVYISRDGLHLVEILAQPIIDIHKGQFSFMTPEEMRNMLDQLTRIRESMDSPA